MKYYAISGRLQKSKFVHITVTFCVLITTLRKLYIFKMKFLLINCCLIFACSPLNPLLIQTSKNYMQTMFDKMLIFQFSNYATKIAITSNNYQNIVQRKSGNRTAIVTYEHANYDNHQWLSLIQGGALHLKGYQRNI